MIREIYENSFPKEERFDFEILEECSKEPKVTLVGITSDDRIVGMEFLVELPNSITYLMYFAIADICRNQGLGTEAIKDLVAEKENVMLCIERPVNRVTRSRKEFYLRNGLHETGVFIEDSGVQYEFLTSKKGFVPTIEDLKNRYRRMTSNEEVWRKISESMDTEIKIVD